MEIIAVLDISGGVAVHAQAGDRRHYTTLKSTLVPDRDGDALAVLRAFHTELGVEACYVADLDAIQGGAVQRTLIRQLAEFHTGFAGALMVDAGTHLPGGAMEVLSCGASEVVVGLETLHAFADLKRIVRLIGPSRVVFSLDMHLGNPILHPALQDSTGAASDPLSFAAEARDAGVSSLLFLDLGRIGTGCGVDLGMVEALRRRFPDLRLLAGGGVLTKRDLERMRDAGCDGALIASALHTGKVTAADLAGLVGPGRGGNQSVINPSR